MHNNINPLSLFGIVIKDKNAQYEIFEILCQTKLKKIKNILYNDTNELCGSSKVDLLDARLEQIRHYCVSKDKNLKYFN